MTKRAQINMSLVPLFIILAIIIGAGYFLIQGELDFSKIFNRGPEIRRLEGFPTVIYTDDNIEKQRLVISDQNQLNEFLNLIDKTGLVTLKDSIDFNKEVLVGVSSETEDPVGHEVKIKKLFVDKEKQTLIVSIEETFPGESCNPEIDKHIAVDLVAISKSEFSIDFDRIKKIDECEDPESKEDEDEIVETSNSDEQNN